MVIGGISDYGMSKKVELVSLDPVNYPVPARLKKLEELHSPQYLLFSSGIMLNSGNHIEFEFHPANNVIMI
jgi:hypothetical protein